MIGWLVERQFRALEAQYGESCDWMRDMVRGSRAGFFKFSLFSPMATHRRHLPVEAYHVARIAVGTADDCGPCLQTFIADALKQGMDEQVLQDAVQGAAELLPAQSAPAYRLSAAVAGRHNGLSYLVERARACYGEAGLVELALAIASARVFPTLKRALGHGETCSQVRIGGRTVPAKPLQDIAESPSSPPIAGWQPSSLSLADGAGDVMTSPLE